MRRRFFNTTKGVDINNYLTIEALEDGLTASLSIKACEYCVDGDGNWKTLDANTVTESINTGHTLSFRSEVSSGDTVSIGTFTVNKNFNLKGNCMSMLFGDAGKDRYILLGYPNVFFELFYNCTTLISVSANFLPATTLSNGCYYSMFNNCTSLTTAPSLPATKLALYCYQTMFSGCTKLNYIKMLATNISAYQCLNDWVNGVASSGTFVKNPEATWEMYGASGIPNGWKVVMDGEENNLKSFQVDDSFNVEEFYFEDGMTWGEWVDSEYNNGDYAIDEMDGSICKLEFGIPAGWIGDSYGYVLSSDIILEETYYLM